jgi:hypothetical protein
MATAKELREEFSKIHTEAQKVIDDAIAAGTELTAEAKTENDKRFARLEQIKTLLDSQGKFAKLALDKGEVTGPTQPAGKAEFEAGEGGQKFTADNLDRKAFGRAMSAWAINGVMAATFATVTTATASSILLPVQVLQPVIPTNANVFRQAHALYGMTPMSTPTTAKFNVPVISPSAGGKVAQNDSSENENEPDLSESIVSQPDTYESGSAWFSKQQINAVDYDLVTGIVPSLQFNKELGFEGEIAAAIIADAGITQVVATATTTTITAANLTSLNNALPRHYNYQKVIILSATAYAAADALYQSGTKVLTTDANGVKRFDGTPVLRCDSFEALSADNVVGCVISLTGFHLRDAGQMEIERYTDSAKPGQLGFDLIGWNAYGYSKSAIAKLKTPAS